MIERLLHPRHAVRVGGHAGGPFRGPQQQGDGVLRPVAVQQVVGDPLGGRGLVCEPRRGLTVGARELTGRQPPHERLAHERMAEAIPLPSPLQHARPASGLERVGDLLLVAARRRRELRRPEAVLEHGQRRKHIAGERRQPLEARLEHLVQPARHGHLALRVDARRQLLHEERVAGAGALDGAHGRLRQGAPGDALREGPDGGAVEAIEGHLHAGVLLDQARPEPRRRPGEPLLAARHDQQERRPAGAAREVVREPDGRVVGGVHVVQREHDRSLPSRSREQLAHRGEQAMAIRPRTLAGGAARRGRRQQREGRQRARREARGHVRTLLEQRLDRLHERGVRGPALLLVRAAAQGVEALPLGVLEQGVQEAALADARRARDQQRAAAARGGLAQAGSRALELAVAADHRHRGQPRRVYRRPARHLRLERERGLGGPDPQP